MVKLGIILVVKLNGTDWHQRMDIGAFALCAIRLVKLTPERGGQSTDKESALLKDKQQRSSFAVPC
jgi:hypothetical protein